MIQIYALDGMDRIGPIDKIISADFDESDLAAGTWQVTLPVPESGSLPHYWQSLAWPGVEAYNPDNGWRFGGYVTSISSKTTAGEEALTFTGLDFNAELDNYLAMPNPDQPLDFWQEVTMPQTGIVAASRQLVLENILESTALDRMQYDGVSSPYVGAIPGAISSPNSGDSTKIEGNSVLEMIRAMMLDTSYTFSAFLDRRTENDPRIRFEGRQRATSKHQLFVDRMDVESIEVERSAASITDVILMGEDANNGTGGKWVMRRYALPRSWRNRQVERFYNRPSTTLDELFDEAEPLRLAHKGGIGVRAVGVEVPDFGAEIKVGDLVSVNLGKRWANQVILTPITKYSVKIKDTGVTSVLTIGGVTEGGPGSVYSDLSKVRAELRRTNIKAG